MNREYKMLNQISSAISKPEKTNNAVHQRTESRKWINERKYNNVNTKEKT